MPDLFTDYARFLAYGALCIAAFTALYLVFTTDTSDPIDDAVRVEDKHTWN